MCGILDLPKSGWDLWAADPPGKLRPWRKGEFLGKGIQDIWIRKHADDPWRIQAMLFDVENGEWIFKRDDSIRRELSSIKMSTKDDVRFLAPEVQLLYKSKSLREKDERDFHHALPAMNSEQKAWLKSALRHIYIRKIINGLHTFEHGEKKMVPSKVWF